MPFDELWNRMARKSPGLSVPENRLTISVKELRRIMGLAYKEGQKQAEQVHKLLGDIFKKAGMG